MGGHLLASAQEATDEDTDFRDSALGEEDLFTDEGVRNMENKTVELKQTCFDIIEQMESLCKAAMDLKEDAENWNRTKTKEADFMAQNETLQEKKGELKQKEVVLKKV